MEEGNDSDRTVLPDEEAAGGSQQSDRTVLPSEGAETPECVSAIEKHASSAIDKQASSVPSTAEPSSQPAARGAWSSSSSAAPSSPPAAPNAAPASFVKPAVRVASSSTSAPPAPPPAIAASSTLSSSSSSSFSSSSSSSSSLFAAASSSALPFPASAQLVEPRSDLDAAVSRFLGRDAPRASAELSDLRNTSGGERIHDKSCAYHLRPSTCACKVHVLTGDIITEQGLPWIWATRRVPPAAAVIETQYPRVAASSGGKWLLFVDRRELDRVYFVLCNMLAGGELGEHIKVSTTVGGGEPSGGDIYTRRAAICVYTAGVVEDVFRVLLNLRDARLPAYSTGLLSWKSDDVTREESEFGKRKEGAKASFISPALAGADPGLCDVTLERTEVDALHDFKRGCVAVRRGGGGEISFWDEPLAVEKKKRARDETEASAGRSKK